MSTSIVSLVGKKFPESKYGDFKWHGSVLCPSNGCVYGIPHSARRVIKFNPKDQSSTDIGDNLGDGIFKWSCGVFAPNNNCIYAVPRNERTILKIDTTNDTVEKLKVKLPEVGRIRWRCGALADDGCIYYFPFDARRILKINPFDDTVSSVGNDLGEGRDKYYGTVKAKDGCLIGIPSSTKRILKFDPINPNNTSIVGEEANEDFECLGNGALGNDGIIYAVNEKGKILAIDVKKNTHSFVATAPQSIEYGWSGAIAGEDGNIYFPPLIASRVLKYNVTTKKTSLVGEDLGDDRFKYAGGSVKSGDGKIYCIPYKADQVLSINPLDMSHQNSNANPLDMSYQNANGGIHDSPHGDPDRLGYNIYAEGLSDVVQKVESPRTSLSVALYAPWGTGKTYLYNLIKLKLQLRAQCEQERILKEKEKGSTNIYRRTLKKSSEVLCHCISLLRDMLCCLFCYRCSSTCKEADSNVEAESFASYIFLFCPIWLVVYILVYCSILFADATCCVIKSIQGTASTGDQPNGEIEPLVQAEEGTGDQPNVEIRRPVQQTDRENEQLFRGEEGTGSQEGNGEVKEAVEDPQKDAWNILLKRASLHGNTLFSDRSCTGKVRFFFLTFASTIVSFVRSFLLNIVPSMIWSRDRYEENSELTKYIFIELNAWVYNGADDLLWASLLEVMWKKVEQECGAFNVRLHRAKIAISGEVASDDINTKRSKRDAAMMMWGMKILGSILLGLLGALFLFIWRKDISVVTESIISVFLSSPLIVVVVTSGSKTMPYLYKSQGTKIFSKASSFLGDKHKRVDFSQKTGFMGEVKKEVGYLFDFIRTTHDRDKKHKALCPYRLSIFVDDLDRCSAETIMEVLQVVVLLLVDAPVTCWLAIDSRLVVASIEKSYGGLFTEAGLDGYKFLEKIVQLPFCFPDLNEVNKINFVRKILEKDELDPLRIHERVRYLKYDVGLVDFQMYAFVNNKDVTEKEAIGVLVKVFRKMVDMDIFHEEESACTMISNPREVKNALENDKALESKTLREELLHYVSVGIELMKDKDPKLDPLIAYERGRYLTKMKKGVFGVVDFGFKDEDVSDKEAIGVLVKVFHKMVDMDIFHEESARTMVSNPREVKKALKKDEALESKTLREEFLRYVSVGIDRIENKDPKLDPLGAYERGRYLTKMKKGVFGVVDFGFKDEDVSDKEAIGVLVKVFEKMVDDKILDEGEATSRSTRSVRQVKDDLENDEALESKTLREEFLRYVSVGIDRIEIKDAYERGRNLRNEGVVFFQDFGFTDEAVSEKEQIEVVVKLFQKMIDDKILKEDEATTRLGRIVREVKDDLDNDMPLESKTLREEILHYVSVGIERIIKNNGSDGEEREKTVHPGPQNGQLPTPLVNPTNEQKKSDNNNKLPSSPSSNLTKYGELFRPMADKSEMETFTRLAKHINGEPRKIKRIINSYMLSRSIEQKRNPTATNDPFFYEKMLKLVILCEQWPYRMAWLMIVIENLQQEKEVADRHWKAPRSGDDLTTIYDKIAKDTGVQEHNDLPLIEIYKYIVEVLLHSPKDAHIELQRDGDPQVFDMLLLDDGTGSSQLKCCDIALPDAESSVQQSIRPYIFNLQRHMTEKVQLYIDNCILHLPTDEDEFNVINYQMKSKVFGRV